MERLYYHDSYLREFDAQIIERSAVNGKSAVVLDRTAFYPSSGGQPNDTGTLNGARVLDVIEDAGRIFHLLEEEIAGPAARGVIDWKRRFDHMQQHTGQHILSQAFIRVAQVETIGFHMGADLSNIDLDNASITEETLWKAEDHANSIVQQNLPVKVIFTDEAGLDRFNLRKDPTKTGEIRIIEIEGFDASACGGTHLRTTGEIGLIKIRRCEKIGSKLRVEFYCGSRALNDYRWKNSLVFRYANRFTVGERELGEAIDRLEEENKLQKKDLKDAKEKLLVYEADEMVKKADILKGGSIVRALFEGRDAQEVKILSSILKKKEKVVALLAVRGEAATLIFSRSDDLKVDVSAVLKSCLELVGGRGGGRPDSAQGGGPEIKMTEKALERAYDLIAQQLYL